MNAFTFSILPLNKRGLAISTLAPLFCCNRVATCCCRPVIRERSYFSLVDGACSAGAIGCPIGCCYCWDIYNGNNDSDDDDDDSS